MNSGIKFHLRFTGPMHRYEIANKPGIVLKADEMEKTAEQFFAALKNEIQFSRTMERDGVDTAIAEMHARNAAAKEAKS